MNKLSDSELYKLCQKFGMDAKLALRKFAGLLPEVMRRRLYLRRGYGSVYEFAAKLAGMNMGQVDRVLRLDRTLENKPVLREMFEEGRAGWSKIETVAFVATPETEGMWATKVEELPKEGLKTFVREYRGTNSQEGSNDMAQSGKVTAGDNSEPAKWNRMSFPVSPGRELKLRQLKQQLEKERAQTVTFDEVMGVLLGEYEEKRPVKKVRVTETCASCVQIKEQEKAKKGETKRYIPADVRRIVLERQGERCAYPGCTKPPDIFHHTRRWAIAKSHDPDYIVALCTGHERVVQAGFVENEEAGPTAWHIREAAPWWDMRQVVDARVTDFRRERAK